MIRGIILKFLDIKFRFYLDLFDDENIIGDIFNKAKHLLNFQFDDDFNVSFIDSDVDYQFKDVSSLNSDDIERITDSFFDFTFDEVCNVFLYRFLVLKNDDKLTVLAIINSSIFDYSSINDFYLLFNNLNSTPLENNLDIYYEDVKTYLNSSDYDEDLIYWRNLALNASDHIKFYNLESNNYNSQKIKIDNGSVSAFIESHDFSLFDFYAGVFALYQSRVDRQRGCLLNTDVQSKRTDLNVFNKTVLKIDFDQDSSFADCLSQFDSVYDEAVDHTIVSIESYLDEDLSYYSVYDFSNLNENIHVYNGEDSVLTLNVYENYLELVYNCDLFSDVYIEHMVKNIENLIGNILDSPNLPISDIDILSDEEKDLLSQYCKGKTAEVDENKFLSLAFRENAKKYPDVVAVDDGINKITFGELEKSSNSIANDLHEIYGITQGSHVALMLPRTYHFPELVLALNKIGATFIPIDLFYPFKRIEYMLKFSQSKYIVTTREVASAFGLKDGVICIEDLNDSNDVDVDIVTRGEDLFTIIFTSGTTGLPKGVMVSNSQVPGVGISFKEIFNYSQGDVIGNYLGFTFVASFVIYAALYFGGCCRIFNEREQKDSLLLIKELKENHMNSLILPPNIGIPIYENEDLQLDYLVLAGAKLNELSKKEKHTKLINFYGTTEIICGVTKIYDLKDMESNNAALGSPVANTWIYILDENGNQMPIGVPGEICVSNKYLSVGYLNNWELTDEVFIDNPNCTCDGNMRMYRTGDIGFYNFEGELEIIGREDDQLSVRGFRVESGEILNIMKSFNEISDVYLDVENDTLTAYYTTSDNLDIGEVKDALNKDLPYYMVPSLFIELDKIPLNINGKLDKSSLKAAINQEDIDIADDVLNGVVDAFKEVLNLDFVLIDDDFVALGGNSLSAMKLQLLLKENLDVTLSSNELMGLSTPKEISDYIKFNLDVHSTVDEDKYTFDEPCPLSESQLNVYLDESVNNMGTAYNNSFKIEFTDKYSVDEIKDALIKLFDVFPVLKARVLNKEEGLFFAFDAEPEVVEGSLNDINTFVKQFELDKYLSRFLIVDDDGSIVLCADFHHLIFDGTSLNILLKKLSSILNNENVDYVDKGVLRQIAFEEIIDSNYMDDAKEFYEGMLADREEAHNLLPSADDEDKESVLIDTFDMDIEYLSSFLQSHSITYNQFFTSVFSYTLSRFSGSEKVLFNIVEDGRGHIDLSESVGMFVKTLPVLMDCENQKVSSFLEYSSNLVNSVMRYDLYPFRVLASEYDLNSNVIFQYSHNLFSDVVNKEDLKYSVDELKHDLDADLSFYILNNGENRLTIRILYSSLYSRSFIEHFVESYKLILNGIIGADQLEDINYTSDNDVEILDEYNQTGHPLPYDDILDAFNDNLLKYPESKLVEYKDASYTYAESAYIADAIGKKLVDLGINAQDRVSFLVPRSELYMFCVLGVVSIGGVYVPLDDALPNERIEFMMEDTESKVLIVSDETYERGCDLAKDCTILNISEIINAEIRSLGKLDVSYGDLACILYTSGSTGLPKGVKITRRSILNFIDFHVSDLDILRGDVYGLFASIGFDVAMAAIFSAMYAGGCVNVIPDDIRLNIKDLNNHFVKYGVTHSYITTQVAKLFIQDIELSSLKVLIAGGEKLGEISETRHYRIVDAYGPTEACVYVISAATVDKIDSSSVGYVQNNTKAYILDDEFRRVPIGAIGELYLSGCQLADGYLNRPEENAKAFMDNPFEENSDYSKLYRTGDMARLLPDKTYGIVGRRDNQVKIRGNRVELSEIEVTIREIDYIDDVTVKTIENGSNVELVAYVVAGGIDEEVLKENIPNYVREHKPEYMVPSFVIKLDEIPLNVNGKVDKHALPAVDLSSLHVEYVAATNEIEQHIVDAFELVFNQKGIGLNDDFVRLGGDSITAIRVISLLEKNHISCNARDILNYKTPYLIAQNVEEITKISYDVTEGEVDLLPIQSYFFDQVNRNDFSQEFILKSNVKLNLDTLQRAFDELSNIHDMLRATYKCDGDNVVQEILPLNSSVCEIKEYDVDNLNDALDNIIKESKDSLDIAGGLIKIGLVNYADECYVTFVIHHLIVDGVSWSILIDDLAYIYNQLENNKEIDILRPYPYKSWVEDVKSLAEDISDDERQHWIEVNGLLDDSTIKGKSKGFAFNVDASFDIDNLLMLSEEEYLALSIARAYKKTFDEAIIFDRETYGRDESLADVGHTFGWFTSRFPVVADVNTGYDAVSLMNDVYSIKTAFKDVEHLGLNYGSLIYTAHELEYRNCPVTFNFLSSEFSFKNELFESLNRQASFTDEMELFDLDSESYGITLNVVRQENSYDVIGDYADNTYIGDGFEEFIDNIKSELEFIGGFDFKDNNIVCCLSEPQLGVYLDEKINEKDTAYSNPGTFECGSDYSIDEIEDAIHALISKHPILRGRVLDTDNVPLLICDGYPPIETVNNEDYSTLIKPFDLDKSLVRFYIVNNDDSKSVFYIIHHIISDATTVTLLNKELEQALLGELNNTVDLGFAYASRDSFESQYDYKYKSAQKFFQNEFADIDEVQYFLGDVDGSAGSVSLPIRGIHEKVERFTKENGITVSNLLNAVFAYTYSRFTGSDKVYYNFTEHGRHENYAHGAWGMFIRTIPVIVDCEDRFIGDFVGYMSDLILKSMANSTYPFRLIAREFDLSNDVIFEYNYDLNEFDIGNEMVVRDESRGSGDFLCVVNDLEDGFLVTVSHTDKFSQNTAKQFVKVFKEMLIQFLEKENLGDINYISNEDIEILDTINQTEHPLEYNDILDAFNDNLIRYPENKLVEHNDVSYTYAEGAFIADKIAKQLIDCGVNPGDRVGFLTERSENYMFSILGILSMGGIYVPLDDTLPDERIGFMIEDANAKVVIATDETYERANSLNNDSIVLNITDILDEQIESLNKLNVCYGNVAGILYTSGTTGIPKGVKITRNAILNVAAYYTDTYDLNNDDVYALYPSIGFDAGCESLFKAIYAGSCLCVVPQDIRLNMSELNRYFINHDVTHTMITTQVGKLFMDTIDETSLKYLFLGGEKLGEFESPKDYILVDEFGPTETNNFITSIRNSDKIHSSSIGYLNYNSKAYILDSEGRQVPYGAVGELYLAGHQVSDGYLNREDETSKSFIDNPFNHDEDYSKLYRTGDMVRILPDGSLSIVGRRDGQVKVRGNRVELSEIESVIREIDYIDDVTVQTIKNNNNNELVAYVVVSDDIGDENLNDAVCDYVGECKPEYMIPSFVIELDNIPLTVNDKVDRSALPDVDLGSLQTEYVAPTNETEKHIVDAFEHVFNQRGIGLNDDFVRLGGDSITAIRVISLLEKNDISCSAGDILNYKTPYLIAQNVQTIENISYDPVEGEVNLLPIQEYFFDQIKSDNFSQYYFLKSNEKLDKNMLQDSFNELCKIHDMLRADYSITDNGKITQEILPVNTKTCEINEVTISDNFEEAFKEIFVKSLNSLNVENNLIEFNLIHYGDVSYIMFVIHHLIIDGVSWDILITDLTHIYNSLKTGEETGLSRPYPYKNWVEDVKNLVNDISHKEKQHWTKINDLLDDSTIKGDTKPFIFDVDVNYDVNNLLMLSEEEYWALAIARAYNRTYGKDIIFKRETYGRDESIAKLNRTIGWFTSQYPILVNTDNEYDDISLMNDVYSIKTAFKEANNLGLNYYSLIYTTKELKYKHCPVTFNFLSSEFSFKNELFESILPDSLVNNDEMDSYKQSLETYGITFNVYRNGNTYNIDGQYAGNTYIADELNTFIENIKHELEFIGYHTFKDNNIVCCLSEPQLGIYLDEKVNEKDVAYSTPRIFECDHNNSVDEIKDAIHTLIRKHPILKGRVLDTTNIPLLICDSYPSIEIVDNEDSSDLREPFELDKSLARFVIVDNEEGKFIFYNIHHIINDATTRTIINKELKQILMGELDDEIDLGFVYASRDSFNSKYDNKYKSAQKFFHDNLADIDDVQYLLRDVDGKIGSVALPIRGIRENVDSFVQNNGITVSSLLNAVFAYTYSRFTGSDKVYYNFTEHGRHEDYLQDAFGMFIRTIPVIVDCENRAIGDYVSYASDLILKSMTNSIYPFRLLARDFNLNNNVLFEYNHDLHDFEISDDIVVTDEADSVSEFTCIVYNLEDGFAVSASHLDKFSQHTAEQFVKAFKEILIQILEKENLSDIDYISNDDIELLDKYNQTQYPLKYNDILDSFNDNLLKCPENKLVSFNDVSYTYGEGAYIADAIGKKLLDLGVEAQDCVSFLVPRSELYMFCLLGIMSIGGIYVPVDDNLPDERIEFMIKDTDSKVLIVSDDTYERGLELAKDCTIVNVSDIINSEIKQLSKLNISYGDLACILYTSGSTGLPKGVKITRKSLVNFIDFHVTNLEILSEDVYGLFASIGFDVAMAAIFSVMYSGACLNIIPNDIRLNINALNNHFIKYGVTHTYITTQIAKLFISQVEKTSLKVLVAGGEKLGQIDEIRDYRIVDAYGPTEACVYVISADTTDKIDYSSVGYVQNNTKAYILDKEFRRIPVGAVGELYLSGIQLADGYLNRDEETAKAFMSNPFENNPEYDMLYCTGDVARILPDGTYGIIGRRDGQVKIRGNRLELTEVESVIREIDYVDDVTVQTIKHDTNNELVAYVVVSNELDGIELKNSICDYVNERKPDYMVPSFVMKLDEIPLNVNGKVDKRALPDVDRSSLHAEYVGPRDEKERRIAEAFERALDLEKVSIYDDFIRLGGDSLTAIKLLSYIDSDDVTMADIFTFRTPEAIANNLSDLSFDLDIYTLESGCPLNTAQINVFADVTVYNKKNAYHIPGFIPIPKEYGLENIRNSLDKLLDAHPIFSMHLSDMYEVNDAGGKGNWDVLKDLISTVKKFGIRNLMDIIGSFGLDVGGLYNMLRTTIRLFKGEYPYMVKGDKPPISVESNINESAIVDFFSESLDLYNYLSKFMIVETEESYYLFYLIHHIIFDATSEGVFRHDLKVLLDGGNVDLDDTFLKTSAFTHHIKGTDKFEEAAEFYCPILSDAGDAGELVGDSSSEGYSRSVYDLEFDKVAFKSFLNKAGISEIVLFSSVFTYTLSQFVDSDKVLFTLIENGRDRFNEDFIGMTSNVMPLVADCKDQSVNSFMEHMSHIVYGASRYSYYPVIPLYQDYDFEVKIMFQFMPNWIADDMGHVGNIEGIDVGKIDNQILSNFSDYLADLFVQIFQFGENYKITISHSNKYSDKMIEDFKNMFMSILSGIIKLDMGSDITDTLK